MEQTYRREDKHIGGEQPPEQEDKTRGPVSSRAQESGGSAAPVDLAIEEFELDDIEEIESKVFA